MTMHATRTEAARQVDCLIKRHLAQNAETAERQRPVAAVSASDRFSWAKQAGVDLEFVEQRMATICHQVTPVDEHCAVPRFRMKTDT